MPLAPSGVLIVEHVDVGFSFGRSVMQMYFFRSLQLAVAILLDVSDSLRH